MIETNKDLYDRKENNKNVKKSLLKEEDNNKKMDEIVKNWIKQADSDLGGAEYNLQGKKLDIASYLCHQSAEKALKALYIQSHNDLWKIHDLVKLAELVKAPENIIHNCNELNPIYTENRYPDFSDTIPAEKFSQEEVKNFLNKSREVI